jgi:hypothetical protein
VNRFQLISQIDRRGVVRHPPMLALWTGVDQGMQRSHRAAPQAPIPPRTLLGRRDLLISQRESAALRTNKATASVDRPPHLFRSPASWRRVVSTAGVATQGGNCGQEGHRQARARLVEGVQRR